MSHVASLRVLALATCACAFAMSSWSTQAAPAATCATAPKSAAPEGSHWRYRTDRSTNRKCWYLASEGGRRTRAVAMPTDTAPEAEVRPPAPPVSSEGIKRLTQWLEETAPRPSPQSTAPVAASAPVEAAPAPVSEPVAAAPERTDPPVVQERVAEAQEPPAPAPAFVPVQQPTQPVAAPKNAAAAGTVRVDADPMTMLPFAFGALAAALLAAGAIIFASGARRRQQTIVRIVDLNAKPPRTPPAQRLVGWSDLSGEAYGSDRAGEEVLQRVTPARRRQAA